MIWTMDAMLFLNWGSRTWASVKLGRSERDEGLRKVEGPN